ncbi:MAG TPA: SsrA-binding protein [Chitinophagaceae bacterium]|jgi:SsrA-binding protein|nr:SsrA-binding protein SmpB [Chitinophagaceae bacterium]HAL95106.1 SsrA-binding protein [Chitinophagaceae bacterium]
MIALQNRQASHSYFIEERYTAGIQLLGTEVKSLREGKASFNDAYCIIIEGEAWIKSLHIAPYTHGTANNHDPLRDRKLLLQKREINKIQSKLKEKGLTLIPLRIFFSDSQLVKVEIGLARGKKLADKRESLKRKEAEREIRRGLASN